MCKWGTLKKVHVIRRANPFVPDGWHEIYVDECIADEIQELNDKGVITEQCCCGHGKGPSNCLIAKESKDLAESFGYEVKPMKKDFINYETLLELKLKIKE